MPEIATESDPPIKEELEQPPAIITEVVPEKEIADQPPSLESPNKRPKAVPVEASNDDLCPEDWRRLIVQRTTGASAGKYDVYYYSPTGKKLRSKKEVQVYCEKVGIEVDLSKFSFSHGSDSRRSTGLKSTPKLAKSPKPKKLTSPDGDPVKKSKTPKIKSFDKEGVKSPKAKKTVASNVIKKEPKSTPAQDSSVSKKKSKNLMKISSAASLTRVRLKSTFVPPKSPFNLIQEVLYHDPWQLLLSTILLNKIEGDEEIAKSTFWEFLEKFSTPEEVIDARPVVIAEIIKPIGYAKKRSKVIKQFSEEYLSKSWTYPKELHGITRYGNDSYKIFCLNEWKKVNPSDHVLHFYVDWLWDNHSVLGLD